MKKRIWLLATALVVAAAALGAGTLAFFTASAGSSGNTFTAGTVNLDAQRSGGETVPGPMFYSDGAATDQHTGHWTPGDHPIRYLTIQNTGSLSAKVMSIRAGLSSGSRELADQLDVTVRDEYDNVVAKGKLRAFIGGDQALIGGPILLDPTDVLSLSFEVSLPLDSGNDFQEKSLAVAFSVHAEQARNNP